MITEYVFEVTTLRPVRSHERSVFNDLAQALAALDDLPSDWSVIYVAALGKGIDYGNFYLFLNGSGAAHIMLHEHREHFAADPLRRSKGGNVEFLDEDGSAFNVATELTTSAARGKKALKHWLPAQAQWPELIWQ